MAALKYGIVLPYFSARDTARLAREAEEAGWDGVFVGDAIWCQDPLIQLAAAAMATERIRLGTMVLATPLRIPWHLASESLALDHLSNGRLILGLGTGAAWMGWQGFPNTNPDTRVRAEMLDETIDILAQMHQSKQFNYDGKHYQIRLSELETRHYPPPTVQQPRVPVWVPAVWPRMKNMRRALKCDGMFPTKMNSAGQFEEITPEDVRGMCAYIRENRTLDGPFDVVIEGKTSGLSAQEAQERLRSWIDAGATWWIESTWELSEKDLVNRLRQGIPQGS